MIDQWLLQAIVRGLVIGLTVVVMGRILDRRREGQ